MSVVPAGTLGKLTSFTRRKAVVKTEICARPAEDKSTCRVTGPGPAAGFGNNTTLLKPAGVEVRLAVRDAVGVIEWVGVGLLTGVLVPVAVGVGVSLKVN